MNQLKGTRILVTGGTGFIGYHLVLKLIELAHRVIVLSRNTPKDIEGFNSSNVVFIRGDINNTEDIKRLEKYNINVIFHLASSANIPKSVEEPEADLFSNALGTFRMLEFAKNNNIRKFIYTSTVSIFDKNNDLPISENARIKVSSPFGASKLTGESYCYAFYRTYGLDTNVIRLFNVFGPGMRVSNHKNFIYDMIQKLLDNPKRIEVLGDGSQIRDYLYINDVIDGLLIIAEKGVPGEDYNLGSGIPVKILDLLNRIANLMNIKNYKINLTGQSWAGDIKKWYADINKAKSLGFRVKTDLEDGLKETIKDILNK